MAKNVSGRAVSASKDDETLISEVCADRDVDAFAALVTRYQDHATRTAYALLGEWHAAEDAAQDAFIQAWLHLPSLRDPRAFAGWLRRIVRNECERVRRKARPTTRLDALEAEIHTRDQAPFSAYANEERRAWLGDQIKRLSSPLRDAVSLHYVAGLPLSEVAELLEVPVGTVKKRLFDARLKLRALVDQQELKMSRDEIETQRPSRDSRFVEQVTQALRAVAAGDQTIVAGLLKEAPAIANARGPHPIWGGEAQPLHVAAERGHVDVVRSLLAYGADVDGKNDDYDGWSPLMLAAYGGRLGIHPRRDEIVELLIAAGASIDIFAAASLDRIDDVARLLEVEPGLAKRTGPAGATALHFARSGAVVKLLLNRGATVDAVCGWGTTPIERASFRGRDGQDVADVLIVNGATFHAPTLASLGDQDRLSALLEADPDAIHVTGKVEPSIVGTPLHGAAAHGHVAVARLLMAKGADLNARADAGQTPLHLAVTVGLDVTKVLIEAGADPDLVDNQHETPPITWARFFADNLDQSNPELERVIHYLENATT